MSLYKLPEQAVRYISEEFRLELALPGAHTEDVFARYTAAGYERISVHQLLQDEALLKRTITVMASTLQAKTEAAAASLFAKAYGRILVGALYAVSLNDICFSLAPERTELLLHPERSELRLVTDGSDFEALDGDCASRGEWTNRQLRRVYAEHLQPMLTLLSDMYSVQAAALWENSLVYILHYYQVWKDSLQEDPARQERVMDDFRHLTSPSESPPFLNSSMGNPFAVEGRLIPHPVHEDRTLRIRKTCCLKSQAGGGRACTVCPCIDEASRIALFDKG
jgi:ferric iron reductase protein FhuF